MTQPIAPGARAACFDELPAPPVECRFTPPNLCAEGGEDAEAIAAGAPPASEQGTARETPGLRFCREADTVAEGYLCGEPVVVSNACRKPNNAVDAYICDEPRMHALQNNVWRATFSVIKAIVSELVGGPKVR